MKMALKICRMPGSGEIPIGKAIRIPRGAVYDEGELGAAFGGGSAGPSPKPISLATAAPAAIAANAFCAIVPVTPIGKPGGAALRASQGTMFTPNRYWPNASGFGALNLTYGYWAPGYWASAQG